MKRSEAEKVMAYVRRHAGEAPRAYIVTGVQWSRPGRNAKQGTTGDLSGGALSSVLNAVAGDPDAWELRLGSVKEQ